MTKILYRVSGFHRTDHSKKAEMFLEHDEEAFEAYTPVHSVAEKIAPEYCFHTSENARDPVPPEKLGVLMPLAPKKRSRRGRS